MVGLGNPGLRYKDTRHNAGASFIRRLSKEWDLRLKRRSSYFKSGEQRRGDKSIVLAIPLTYMNRSGYAVREILERYGLPPERLVVVYDDLDIPLGTIRIRKEGGAGTHKGMHSVIQELETEEFPRLRLGIGPLPAGEDATQFVLSSFEKEERPLFHKSLEKAKEALEMIFAGEIDKAMNMYNTRGESLGD
ncbi:MAG: aminoacyl-tRNA hydrolase [Candidatus Aminicenantales bacterium]